MNQNLNSHTFETVENKLKHFEMIKSEADTIREKDKRLIKGIFQNFYDRKMNVGIGFKRAHGSILSGDFFDLISLSDGSYMFIFADISGHGLPAYTTLIRLRSAIVLAIKASENEFYKYGIIDTDEILKNIITNFTDIMDEANSYDFACVNFAFIYNLGKKYKLKFYNRSMLFPIIISKKENRLDKIVNLNVEQESWLPQKGYLMGSDVRKLLRDSYLETPPCEYVINEGDSILFFSDGVIEAHSKEDPDNDFGETKIEEILEKNHDYHPQIIVHQLFESVYHFIGNPKMQKDDMTAVLIEFPGKELF